LITNPSMICRAKLSNRASSRIRESGIIAERTAAGIHLSVNIMVDGRRVHRRFGLGATITECRQFIEQSRTDARHGRLNLPPGRKLRLTVEKAASDYLDRLARANGRNLKIKARHLRMYLIPHFAGERLDHINDFAVERYKKARREAGAARQRSIANWRPYRTC
jgi:hypothetical protein